MEQTQDIQQSTQQIQPNQPSHPNQWYTPVIVAKYSVNGENIENKVFSDLQLAWMYIKSRIGEINSDEEFITSFQRTIQHLLQAHQQNNQGFLCAFYDNILYYVYYSTEDEYRGYQSYINLINRLEQSLTTTASEYLNQNHE